MKVAISDYRGLHTVVCEARLTRTMIIVDKPTFRSGRTGLVNASASFRIETGAGRAGDRGYRVDFEHPKTDEAIKAAHQPFLDSEKAAEEAHRARQMVVAVRYNAATAILVLQAQAVELLRRVMVGRPPRDEIDDLLRAIDTQTDIRDKAAAQLEELG